jgi:hypothetical protein
MPNQKQERQLIATNKILHPHTKQETLGLGGGAKFWLNTVWLLPETEPSVVENVPCEIPPE